MATLIGMLALLAGFVASQASGTPAVTMSATPQSVSPNGTTKVVAAMPVSDAGTVSQEIIQTLDPTRLRIGAASDITAPVGWGIEYFNGSAWSATAPASAAAWAQVTKVKSAGSIVSEGASGTGKQVASRTAAGVLAAAGGSIAASGGGDGWDLFFDPEYTRIFNRNHHEARIIIDCHWLRTEDGHTAGQRCWTPTVWQAGAGLSPAPVAAHRGLHGDPAPAAAAKHAERRRRSCATGRGHAAADQPRQVPAAAGVTLGPGRG